MKTLPIRPINTKKSGTMYNIPDNKPVISAGFGCCQNHIKQSKFAKAHVVSLALAQQTTHNEGFKSLYMPSGVSFKGALLNAAIITPDVTNASSLYRSALARAVGATADSLMSILSPDKLKEILSKAKPENFSTGNNFENILNGEFRINLHMHLNSDGTMSVRELLEQAARYADYRKTVLHKEDPVIIGITDHDMLEGSKEAVRIIAKTPERYRNIQVVLGAEFNTHYGMHQFEAIGYCLNPFDEGLNALLESRRQINREYLESFLRNEVNQWEEAYEKKTNKSITRTTLDKVAAQAKYRDVDCGKHLKYFGSPGLMLGFTNALKSIFYERGWNFIGIDKFSERHGLTYKSFSINPGTPTLDEITKVIKDSGSGFIGIAHPCRNFGGMDLRYLFPKFKAIGVEAAEVNYQYPVDEAKFPKSFQEHVELASNQSGLIKTGGQDNHRDNMFTQMADLRDLPDKVQKIIKPTFADTNIESPALPAWAS